ncbi:DHHW family protein [Bacillus weihaiensis]|uniref:DHHW family protein n=1 Tax=Bacillus weihaiensis TaxID=1547283 RepID=UPI0023573813|nr:DHHW family protein [Bacillus weihaiensis]
MKLGNYFLTLGFIGIIFSFGIFTILLEDKPKSFFENRKLAQSPEFGTKDILNGNLFKDYELYFTDQFVGRDKWVENYTKWKLVSGETYVNGYHVTNDQLILENPIVNVSEQSLNESAEAINSLGEYLKEKQSRLFYVPAPAKVHFTTDYLPSYAPKGNGIENTNHLISRLDNEVVKTIPLSTYFNENFTDEELVDFYFKTDHHWNMKGAFKGYQLMMSQLSKEFKEIPLDFTNKNYTYSIDEKINFIGSYNLSLYMLINSEGDHPNYYLPKNYSFDNLTIYSGPIDKKRLIKNNGNIYASGYNKELKEFDYGRTYTFNYDELNIVNEESKNKLRVLLLKDSYANPIIPHIAHHFHTTTVYDMRYNKDRTVYDYLDKHEYDLVIVFYNTNNLIGPMYRFNG